MSERVVLPTSLRPSHYKLELSPDLDSLTFTCNEEIRVNVSDSVSEVTLHSKEIVIEEASFKHESGTSASVFEITYNTKLNTVRNVLFRYYSSTFHISADNGQVRLGFDNPVAVGEGVLFIKYRGILNGDMAGFYKSSYSDASGVKKIMASTQFEALDARRAFPCWDEPAIKATFGVTIIIPAHLTAISNMPEIQTLHLAGAKKKVTFEVSPKMSTYLLAWAVGEFDMVQAVTKNNVAIRVFSPPGRAEQGKFALDCGVRALDFYDDFFQVPYPLPKLDMICVTEFAMGAMENWGLVTYREVDLMIDEAKASSQQRQRVAIVVAHELAHQWFGNLVTMSWWDGLWLNEGFAAWMEHFAVDALYPDYKIWEQYTTDGFGAAQRLDSLRTSHPIIVPIKHAEEVEQVFDAISYCKGSTVVNMVASVLGKEKFREGLQLYMKRHAYQNTETADLWQAWTEVSGINVADLMERWTKRMGYPYLKVVEEKWSDSALELTLEQAWFLADGSEPTEEEASTAVWKIPLLFATSAEVSDTAVIMEGKRQTLSIPLAGPGDWVKINAGQKALVRVAASPEMTARLQPAIKSLALGAVDRAALLLDSYALAKANLAPIDTVVEVLRAMVNENSYIGWTAISGILSALYLQMEQVGGAAFEAFKEFGKTIVLNALAQIGWDAQPSDGHTEKLLRNTVIGLLDSFAPHDPAVLAEARRRFDAHWEDPSVLPSDYKNTVYKIVLLNGGETEYEQVLKTYYATEDNAVKKFAFTLGAAPSPALKQRTLDWAVKSGDVKTQDFFYPISNIGLLAWDYYKANFAYIKEKLAKASPSLMDATIIYSTNKFCTSEQADELEAFFAANPLPSSGRRISQSVEVIRSNAALLARIKESKLAEAAFWQA